MIGKDINRSGYSGPVSIKEMLAKTLAKDESGKSEDTFPIRITFTLPPDVIELSAGQRADLADKLRRIDTSTPCTVVISSGPGGRSGDITGAFVAVQRALSAAAHFSAITKEPILRYDPSLAPGELSINIDLAKKSGHA